MIFFLLLTMWERPQMHFYIIMKMKKKYNWIQLKKKVGRKTYSMHYFCLNGMTKKGVSEGRNKKTNYIFWHFSSFFFSSEDSFVCASHKAIIKCHEINLLLAITQKKETESEREEKNVKKNFSHHLKSELRREVKSRNVCVRRWKVDDSIATTLPMCQRELKQIKKQN